MTHLRNYIMFTKKKQSKIIENVRERFFPVNYNNSINVFSLFLFEKKYFWICNQILEITLEFKLLNLL